MLASTKQSGSAKIRMTTQLTSSDQIRSHLAQETVWFNQKGEAKQL
jgi:hypothetical protein